MTALTSIVTFKPCPFGRETAHLGDKLVGEVAPWGPGAHRAYARVYLPDVARKMYPAASLADARDAVRREVADWLDGAGLTPVRRRA